MAEKSTIARPYAKAAFAHAQEQGALRQWSEALATASAVVSDPQVARLLGNPTVTPAQLAGLIGDICGPQLDEHGRDFLKLLAEERRLARLPEIAAMFEAMRAEAENIADVEVVSAAPLDDRQREQLTTTLKQRFNRDVRMHCKVDASLLGGAVIRSGDLVIDGSLKTRLDQLAASMAQ